MQLLLAAAAVGAIGVNRPIGYTAACALLCTSVQPGMLLDIIYLILIQLLVVPERLVAQCPDQW
jgi:hypothetical protein